MADQVAGLTTPSGAESVDAGDYTYQLWCWNCDTVALDGNTLFWHRPLMEARWKPHPHKRHNVGKSNTTQTSKHDSSLRD